MFGAVQFAQQPAGRLDPAGRWKTKLPTDLESSAADKSQIELEDGDPRRRKRATPKPNGAVERAIQNVRRMGNCIREYCQLRRRRYIGGETFESKRGACMVDQQVQSFAARTNDIL